MIFMLEPVNIENARIGFKNFEGREGMYNKKGERSFAVFLDQETAEELDAKGWNIKFPKERDDINSEEDTRTPYLIVSVGFDFYPANVFLISNGKPTKISEEEVSMLDWAEIENIDLVIRPYEWSVNRSSGIKAYLKSGYFTIATDVFAEKYGI